ncbi:MAG: crossover junction endodeoxyribonuclease RuvC [Anaerolineales bacterium]|nr:crossover junction endodeoxyribonuclease RuvC [Anaerolineales bacterium]
MLVIGIDPGTATTGYGFVQEERDGTLTAVAYGVVTTPAGQEMPKRLVRLHEELAQLIILHRPESGAVEKLFFQKNVKTAITVAQGRGVALLALAQAGLPIGEYTPLEVKQSVVGYGNADKGQVQQMVRVLLGLETIPKPDDAADALAIAICHLHMVKSKTWYEDGQ